MIMICLRICVFVVVVIDVFVGFAKHLKAFYAYVNSFYSANGGGGGGNKHIGLWL